MLSFLTFVPVFLQDSMDSGATIELLIAIQEHTLIKAELEAITPKDWAG